jgi:hypothetical protein
MAVTGIGGFFFRARDPEAVRAWYAEHLGVGSSPYGVWETQAGPSGSSRSPPTPTISPRTGSG